MQKARMEPIAADRSSKEMRFDSVKLELAVLLLVALGTTLVIVRLDAPHWLELLLVASVGLGGGGWLALRTRRIVRAAEAEALESLHGRPGRDNAP